MAKRKMTNRHYGLQTTQKTKKMHHWYMVRMLTSCSRSWVWGLIKPKTIKCVFAASLLSMQH